MVFIVELNVIFFCVFLFFKSIFFATNVLDFSCFPTWTFYDFKLLPTWIIMCGWALELVEFKIFCFSSYLFSCPNLWYHYHWTYVVSVAELKSMLSVKTRKIASTQWAMMQASPPAILGAPENLHCWICRERTEGSTSHAFFCSSYTWFTNSHTHKIDNKLAHDLITRAHMNW